MKMNNQILKDLKQMVISTKNIINNKKEILSVWHDSEDGMWQFLDGTDIKEEDAMIVSLEEIIGIDYTIREVLDLPMGWVAWRDRKDSVWNRKSQI